MDIFLTLLHRSAIMRCNRGEKVLMHPVHGLSGELTSGLPPRFLLARYPANPLVQRELYDPESLDPAILIPELVADAV